MADGRRGRSGPSATAAAAAATRSVHAAAPTRLLSTAAPSVKARASRSWRAILSAQVRRENKKTTIRPLRSGWERV